MNRGAALPAASVRTPVRDATSAVARTSAWRFFEAIRAGLRRQSPALGSAGLVRTFGATRNPYDAGSSRLLAMAGVQVNVLGIETPCDETGVALVVSDD